MGHRTKPDVAWFEIDRKDAEDAAWCTMMRKAKEAVLLSSYSDDEED